MKMIFPHSEKIRRLENITSIILYLYYTYFYFISTNSYIFTTNYFNYYFYYFIIIENYLIVILERLLWFDGAFASAQGREQFW